MLTCCSLLCVVVDMIVYCLLCGVGWWLGVGGWWLLGCGCWIEVDGWLLFLVCCLLFAIRWLFFVVVRCVLFVVCFFVV